MIYKTTPAEAAKKKPRAARAGERAPDPHEALQARLAPGEPILWSSGTTAEAQERRFSGVVAFGRMLMAAARLMLLLAIGFAGAALAGDDSAAGPCEGEGVWNTVLMAAICGGISVALWAAGHRCRNAGRRAAALAGQTAHAMTDRRAIVTVTGAGDGVETQTAHISFGPAQLGSFTIEERADGSGDVLFDGLATFFQKPEIPSNFPDRPMHGWYGVAGVAETQELMMAIARGERGGEGSGPDA